MMDRATLAAIECARDLCAARGLHLVLRHEPVSGCWAAVAEDDNGAVVASGLSPSLHSACGLLVGALP